MLLAPVLSSVMDWNEVNKRAIEESRKTDGQVCQEHVRAVQRLLGDKYKVEAVWTPPANWGRGVPHRSALVHTDQGPLIFDNGAMGMGTDVLPMSALKGEYRIRQLDEGGDVMHVWPWQRVSNSLLRTVIPEEPTKRNALAQD